jgi:hypothetical protein
VTIRIVQATLYVVGDKKYEYGVTAPLMIANMALIISMIAAADAMLVSRSHDAIHLNQTI